MTSTLKVDIAEVLSVFYLRGTSPEEASLDLIELIVRHFGSGADHATRAIGTVVRATVEALGQRQYSYCDSMATLAQLASVTSRSV